MAWFARTAAFLWLLLAVNSALADDAALRRYEYVRPAMGTQFRIVLYANDEPTARRAADAAFARVEQLNGILSDYEDASELSRLSATSRNPAAAERGMAVGSELWSLLDRSQRLSEASAGAFDITVGPYSRLWRRARRQQELPSGERLAEAKEAVGYRHLRLDPEKKTVTLLRPDMRLDLGGIAKGYAADEALAALRKSGVTRAMVAASGDIALGDAPPGAKGWRIGVAPLAAGDKPSKFLQLAACGISTSGDAFQYVTIDGRRYSHIVDPRTGIGLTTPSSVTVVASDATTADSLATALCVLGPDAGSKLLEKHAGCEMLFVREVDGKTTTAASAGFERLATDD